MPRPRRARVLLLSLALAAVGASGACSGPPQLRYERELETLPGAARHAVHSERLRELMRGLDRLRTERLPQSLDPGVEIGARGEQVERVALALAASAAQIEEAAPDASSDPEEQREFRAYAFALRQRSQALAQRAGEWPPVDLAPDMAAVNASCDACHARFRPGGPHAAQ